MNYLSYPVKCIRCGISYTPSDNTEAKRLLKVPPLYANNFCSRKCKEEYDKILLQISEEERLKTILDKLNEKRIK
jgi:DNA-directed RNA polymerase subunit N (RpoN/RPB10)